MDNQGLIRLRVSSLEFEVSGREEFVESQLQRFLNLLPPDAISKQLGALSTPLEAASGTNHQSINAVSPVQTPQPPQTLLDFYKGYPPTTDIERVTVLAAYLRDLKGQEEVTQEMLHPLFRELAVRGQQPAKNITNGIWNAASKGKAFLERVEGKRSTYRLTNAGAALVYNTLPERVKNRLGKGL